MISSDKMTSLEQVLHRIERKYAKNPLYNEVCGLTVLCLLARNSGQISGITDLHHILMTCGQDIQCAKLIEEAIGSHWNEYYDLIGRYTEDDLIDLFERQYVREIRRETGGVDWLDRLSLMLLNPHRGESCLDLCSGAGFFLNAAWLAMSGADDTKTELAGIEYNPELARYSSLLSIVRGNGGKMHIADCFDPKFLRAKFDKVHCDAPFGVHVRDLDYANLQRTINTAFPDFPPISLTSAAWLFAARAVAALKPNGRAVVIMPQSALSDEQGAQYRRFFIARGMVESVVAFPDGTYPGTSLGFAVVTLSHDCCETKFFDAAEYVGLSNGVADVRVNKILLALEKICNNYEDIITRDRDYLLSEGGSLDPVEQLAGQVSYENHRRLGDVAHIRRGVLFAKSEFKKCSEAEGEGERFGYLTPGNINDGVIDDKVTFLKSLPKGGESALVECGDLVVSRSSSQPKIAVASTPGVRYLADTNLIVLHKPRVDPYYLMAYLLDDEGAKWLRRVSSGLQRTISLKRLQMVPVPVVDAEKMREIGLALRERLERIRELSVELERQRGNLRFQYIHTMNGGGIIDGD